MREPRNWRFPRGGGGCRYIHVADQWRKFRWCRGATAPRPPSVNRHSLSEIFGSVRLFKTTEYTKISRKNYWRVRQLICTELRLDYLQAICMICWVNHFDHFCAGPYLVKNMKTMKKSKQICQKFAPPPPELNFRPCCRL